MEEEYEEAECDVVCNTSFIYANLQDSIAASRVPSRTVRVKVIVMALIQEPWYCKDYIRGRNILGYTLFSAGGIGRPRSFILKKNKTTCMLPGFSCRDLVAVLIKYNEDGTERRLFVCCAYLPIIPRIHPPVKGM